MKHLENAKMDGAICSRAGEEPILLESNQNHATIQNSGICTTLPASMGLGGGYVPMVMEKSVIHSPETQTSTPNHKDTAHMAVYGIDHVITTGGNCTAQGPCVYEEIEATLKAAGPHAVAYSSVRHEMNQAENNWIQEQTGALMASGYSKLGTQEAANGMYVIQNLVRRLTPRECERLQAMPDDWSRWGVNEKGEVYELPDSARYRLQGNGIATPFFRWALSRIGTLYDYAPTMGSLFDGQASFPMIWEELYGKGTVLWSSEIEKHAVAVARFHFPDTVGELSEDEKRKENTGR